MAVVLTSHGEETRGASMLQSASLLLLPPGQPRSGKKSPGMETLITMPQKEYKFTHATLLPQIHYVSYSIKVKIILWTGLDQTDCSGSGRIIHGHHGCPETLAHNISPSFHFVALAPRAYTEYMTITFYN